MEQTVYRDLDGVWGAYQLVVDGVDVTRFRGVPSQIGGYQLTQPYGYGPAAFAFPGLTSLDVGLWGSGDLTWLRKSAPVKLFRVRDGVREGGAVWHGYITKVIPGHDGTEVVCDGRASGRLAAIDKHPELFNFVKDAGVLVWEAFRKADLPCSPRRGLVTGQDLYERGLSGGSLLDYVDQVLALTEDLTVMPSEDGGFEQRYKDRTTVHATVHLGAAGIDLDVSSDLLDEPNRIYGSGRAPSGLLWVNGKYPGLVQGEAPVFPGTLSEGATGDDVYVLTAKLRGMGFLDPDDEGGRDFTADVVDAVEELQDQAGLNVTGVVNEKTWNALFDLGDTGYSLRRAHVAPLDQLTEVRRFDYTANGSVAGLNPDYDSTRVKVDRTVDFGVMRRQRARKWARKELRRLHSEKNWQGVLTLDTDLFVGTHLHSDVSGLTMSRLDVRPGMNILVRNFDGDTLFHVAGVNVDSDCRVRLAVDTLARDLVDVAQRIEANRAARSNPARKWLRERRQTGANQQIVEWSEVGGRVYNTIKCGAGKWTVFPVIAGQSGSVERIRVKVTDSKCEYVVALFAKEVSGVWVGDKFGNPFNADAWTSEKAREQADDARVLLGAWGDEEQPCGYYPKQKTNDSGEATGAPLTGVMLDAAGLPYFTFDQPVLWVAIYPKQACKIEPQRVLWPVLESGM